MLTHPIQILAAEAHFSHVAPFPVSFPYAIEPPFPASESPNYIEKWLAEREAVHPVPPSDVHPDAPLRKYTSKHRDTPLELIGLAEAGLRDCVPHLDVGDAFALLGTPGLAPESDETGGPQPSDIASVTAARQDLIDVLSGQCVLMAPDDTFAPWALRYSGHQFGSFAGQLGDGRAISIRPSVSRSAVVSFADASRLQMSRRTHQIRIARTSSSSRGPAGRRSRAPRMASLFCAPPSASISAPKVCSSITSRRAANITRVDSDGGSPHPDHALARAGVPPKARCSARDNGDSVCADAYGAVFPADRELRGVQRADGHVLLRRRPAEA